MKFLNSFLTPSILLSIVVPVFLLGCGSGGGEDEDNSSGSGDECLSSATCPLGEFCNFTDFTCGASGLSGACTTIPVVDCNLPAVEPDVTAIVGPVCTCDRLTFNNQCFAEAASQSLAGAGECP